jgi:hypothetical protein
VAARRASRSPPASGFLNDPYREIERLRRELDDSERARDRENGRVTT